MQKTEVGMSAANYYSIMAIEQRQIISLSPT